MSLRAKIKARMWSRILGRPSVVLPLALGAVTLGLAAMMGVQLDAVQWPAGICLAIGGYNAVRMYLEQGPALIEQESEKLERQLASNRDATLEELRHAFELDEDYTAVGEVDTLSKHLDRLARGRLGDGFRIPEAFGGALDQLKTSCIASLRKVARLGSVADDLSTDEARQEVEGLRSDLLTDVKGAIAQLGVALDRLQLRAVRDDPGDEELPRLRKELDAQLEVARRVESRLEKLEQRLAPLRQHGG